MAPEDLTPESRRLILRKISRVIFGFVLWVIPPLVLLIVGLIAGSPLGYSGLIWPQDFACSTVQWLHCDKPEPWKNKQLYLKVLLGSAALVTREPLWFQLELTLTFIIVAGVLTVQLLRHRANALSDLEIFDPEIVGRFHSTSFKLFFLAGLFLLSMANLWFALYQSDHAWLVFRSLAPAAWFICFTTFTTWSAFKNVLTKASSSG